MIAKLRGWFASLYTDTPRPARIAFLSVLCFLVLFGVVRCAGAAIGLPPPEMLCPVMGEIGMNVVEMREIGANRGKFLELMRSKNAGLVTPALLNAIMGAARIAWDANATPEKTLEIVLDRCYRTNGVFGTEM